MDVLTFKLAYVLAVLLNYLYFHLLLLKLEFSVSGQGYMKSMLARRPLGPDDGDNELKSLYY